MSVGTEYVLHGIRLPSGEDITQLSGHTNNPTVEQMTAMSAGNPHVQFASVVSVKPQIDFTTSQLKTLLDKVAAASGCATAALTGGNIDLYYKKVENLGLRIAPATTQHRRYRGTAGMLLLQSLTVEHRGVAEAQAQIVLQFDGTNPPIVPAGSVALLGTAQAAQQYTLGPVYIGGTQLPSLQRTSWSPQIALFRDGSESEVFDSFLAAQTVDSLFTFGTLEAGVWDTFGITGAALSGAGLEVYLRKKDINGHHVANATAEHIKITGGVGQVVLGASSGGGADRLAHELTVQVVQPPNLDSPLVINTASAIPTGA